MILKWLSDINTRVGWWQTLTVVVVIVALIAGASYAGMDVAWLVALFGGS